MTSEKFKIIWPKYADGLIEILIKDSEAVLKKGK